MTLRGESHGRRKSKIEWYDATWNPITGCTPVSEGCRNCYAARMVNRFPKLHGTYPEGTPLADFAVPFGMLQFHDRHLDQPLRWKRPRRIFVGSMTDIFHENVPEEWIGAVLAAITNYSQHAFLILTKRPERMRKVMTADYLRISRTDTWPIRNLCLGVSVETQKTADERIPLLLQTPAAKRFASVEPCIGAVDLRNIALPLWREKEANDSTWPPVRIDALSGHVKGPDDLMDDRLDWIICGGETGPGARPMHPDWVRGLRDQCKATNTPFFFKQWGKWPDGVSHGPNAKDGAYAMARVGKKAASCLLDGQEHKEFPVIING